MILPEEVQKILMDKMPGAEVTVRDMKGGDHFEVTVLWEGFAGKGLIEQHKMVNQALTGELESGRVHALKIKTYAAQ